MSRILVIGTAVPSKTQNFCFVNGIKHAAADIALNYMIHGLDEISSVESIDCVGAVRMKPYPIIKIKKITNDEEKIKKGISYGVGYSNMPLLGFVRREKNIIKKAKQWAKEHRDDKDVIILIYSMHSPFMKAAIAVKKIIPSAKILLTVADLPLFMDMGNKIRLVLKKFDWCRIKKLMGSVDKYLLYTKYMADYLQLPDGKWSVFEGLIDSSKVVTKPQPKYEKNICIYAGNLDPQYGIDMLIKAFGMIKSDAVLHIYGAGQDIERIKKLAAESGKAEYKGVVTSDEMFEIMKKATLLINPRPSDLGLAKYSCPSKTFEYMASGTPVLMTKLPGLPDEYHKYVYFVDEESAAGFANKIDEIFAKNKNEIAKFGIDAAAFLLDKKNSKVVMEKALNFVEDN